MRIEAFGLMHAYAAVLITYLLKKHVWTMNKIRYETTSYTPHLNTEECGLLQKSKEIPTPWDIYIELIFLP